MVRVGILSDTHGTLRLEIETVLQACDYIIHAGDVDRKDVLERLRQTAPTYLVRGNNDREWARYIQRSEHFSIEGVKFFVVHDRRDVPKALGSRQVVIYGHSHRYSEETVDGRLWLNPGSASKPRDGLEITMAIMEIEDGAYRVEKMAFPLYPWLKQKHKAASAETEEGE